jgi:ADP-dependent NAD(P)H-hydrate dehydratase / NAD(P)H-hydrate epimerase
VIPIVTPEEMAAIDAAAPEPVDVLVGRAGAAVARAARRMLGGTYGRVVNVIAGKGNNGADGRVAGELLAAAGVAVRVFEASAGHQSLPAADLVLDAAYGTGFRGQWRAPTVGAARVLAVDIPSGVDGLTGQAGGRPVRAASTVTFAALKPGLLFHPGRALAGEVTVADIGLDVSGARVGAVEAADVAGWVPGRPPDSHKWRAAVMLAAGSPGMTGAAHLAARAAYRAGAGMVRVATPGLEFDPALPTEAVGIGVPAAGWDAVVIEELGRMGALVLGPGLGRGAPAVAAIHHLVGSAPVPLVVDGDGLSALGTQAAEVIGRRGRDAATVLTPHDGEFGRLAGEPPGPDRIAAARGLAAAVGAIVLLKGPTTAVAHPDGWVRLNVADDARLATAGTGDVLSGVIGALLAQGVDAFDAAAAGAWLHTRAAQEGPARGLIASDVVEGLPAALAAVTATGVGGGH